MWNLIPVSLVKKKEIRTWNGPRLFYCLSLLGHVQAHCFEAGKSFRKSGRAGRNHATPARRLGPLSLISFLLCGSIGDLPSDWRPESVSEFKVTVRVTDDGAEAVWAVVRGSGGTAVTWGNGLVPIVPHNKVRVWGLSRSREIGWWLARWRGETVDGKARERRLSAWTVSRTGGMSRRQRPWPNTWRLRCTLPVAP
jgi:hypothetical protein